jgi:hypothetical protein
MLLISYIIKLLLFHVILYFSSLLLNIHYINMNIKTQRTALPTVSVLPPAAKGTIRLRDFLGKSSFVSVDADF